MKTSFSYKTNKRHDYSHLIDPHISNKPVKLNIETFNLARIVNDSKHEGKWLLTDGRGRKLCAGNYDKCDKAWAKRLDTMHYTEAGVLWFIHAGHAFKMPGY